MQTNVKYLSTKFIKLLTWPMIFKINAGSSMHSTYARIFKILVEKPNEIVFNEMTYDMVIIYC